MSACIRCGKVEAVANGRCAECDKLGVTDAGKWRAAIKEYYDEIFDVGGDSTYWYEETLLKILTRHGLSIGQDANGDKKYHRGIRLTKSEIVTLMDTLECAFTDTVQKHGFTLKEWYKILESKLAGDGK